MTSVSKPSTRNMTTIKTRLLFDVPIMRAASIPAATNTQNTPNRNRPNNIGAMTHTMDAVKANIHHLSLINHLLNPSLYLNLFSRRGEWYIIVPPLSSFFIMDLICLSRRTPGFSPCLPNSLFIAEARLMTALYSPTISALS